LSVKKLYEHQKAALEQLHNGAILVGAVGSGKSLTALAYIHTVVGKGKSPKVNDRGYSHMKVDLRVYVITTARKRDSGDWMEEAGEFLMPLAAVDSWNNIDKYENVKDAFFIFDEQRLIGNGAWVKSFYKIAANNQWLVLTGTPGDNWMDYIPIMVANGYYKNRTEFIRRHVVYNRFSRYPKVERYVDTQRLIDIRNRIVVNMHFVRNTTRHDFDVICEFDEEKQHKLMIERWNIFEEKPVRDVSELCRLMRQLVNSDPSRLVKLKEVLDEHPKLIIFYNFNFELSILEQFAKDNDIPYSQWNGHKHEAIQSAESTWLYLCQYIAASEAWNCIETDTIVFFSLNYSYRIMEQAAGRIDRLSTPFEHLYYYRFTSYAIIDMAILKAIKKKRLFNEYRYMDF